jgi:hypothetical protein
VHEGAVYLWGPEVHAVDTLLLLLALIEQVLLRLLEDVHREEVPEVDADLEQLRLWDVGALDQVDHAFVGTLLQDFYVLILHCITTGFDQVQVLLQNRSDS